MKKVISSSCIALAAFVTFSCNSGSSNDSVSEAQDSTEQRLEATNRDQGGMVADADHMIVLASSNMFEVEAGKLAAEQAQHQDVKNYGQMMVSDHSQAGDQMKTLAQQKNIVLPTTLGNDHQEELNELREKRGAEFDQAYMDAIVSAHDEDIDRLEDLQDSEDPQVGSFAQTMLPKLREHHQQAQAIEDRVNSSGTRADRDARRTQERDERGGWRYRTNQVGNSAQEGVNNAAQSTEDAANRVAN